MLQIPNNSYLTNQPSYENLAAAYLPPGDNTGVITLATQHETIIWLNADAVNGHFYFIVDVAANTLLHCYGVERWLGYADKHFTTKKYNEIPHPSHALLQAYYGAALWQLLVDAQLSPLVFMQPVCATLIALKSNSGNYVYCRRLCSPFQLTAGGRATQYLCRFTVIGQFANEPYHTRLFGNGHHLPTIEKAMRATVQKQFEKDAFFSPQELRLLKKYATDHSITSAAVADSFKISSDTVNIYNKRIIEKADKLFAHRFGKAKEVAAYIKRMGLI
jgi:hypothetical protein